MHAMPIERTQRAIRTFRKGELATGVTVVGEQHRATAKRTCHGLHPVRQLRKDLRAVTVFEVATEIALYMADGATDQRVGRPVRTMKTPVAVEDHVFLVDLAVANREARGRQRVDHFVGEEHAVPVLLGGAVEPYRTSKKRRRQRGMQSLALTLAQVGTGFEDHE